VALHLYIIRHGQTDNNAKGIVQGRSVNLPINHIGQQQALQFWNAYSHIPFDYLYTSSMLRAQQSVSRFLAQGVPHIVLPGLDEISWGSFEGVTGIMDKDSVFLDLLTRWKAGDIMIKAPGGESPLDVQERQQEFIQRLGNHSRGNVLVCMHGRALRILLCTLTGTPLTEMEVFPHSNLCLYHILLQGGRAEFIQFNDTAHLQEAIL
jgi:broad specificity phosphatase PhoE